MPTIHDLKLAVMKLPLTERQDLLETIERSISDEVDRMAATCVAEEPPFTSAQQRELQTRLDSANRGDATYVKWEQVRQNVAKHLPSNK